MFASLNFSGPAQNAMEGLMEIAQEAGLVEAEGEAQESPQKPSETPQSDSEDEAEESIVPDSGEDDNAPEDSEDDTEESTEETPLDKALKQAQAELEGERSKNRLLEAKNSLPPIPAIVPFGKLPSEIQGQILSYCEEYGTDPHQIAHDWQLRTQLEVKAQHDNLERDLESRKAASRDSIKDAILGHSKAEILGEAVAKILNEAKLVDNVTRMDKAGFSPEEIKDYALPLIAMAYDKAEREDLTQKKQRLLSETSKQKAKLKKATRGEATRASSTPAQSSQGEAEKLFDGAFDVKNASPWKRMLG